MYTAPDYVFVLLLADNDSTHLNPPPPPPPPLYTPAIAAAATTGLKEHYHCFHL